MHATTRTSAPRLAHWRRWLARMLLHHLPEEPYPSNHPSSLRRTPPELRG